MRRPGLMLAFALMCLPSLVGAELRRQDAGACQVWADVPEDPALHWDYWWSGACAGGLAAGPGFLLQFMRGGGFGDVYAARMVQGRMDGEVGVYGPRFLGAEWTARRARVGPEGEPGDERALPEALLSRFALPLALQQALDRFAHEVGHPQMPGLPLPAAPDRCPAAIDGQGRPVAQGQGTDVAGFIRMLGGGEAARREALLQALDAQAAQRATPAEARRRLALATAVAGCVAAAATGAVPAR